jgi:hypothetical protein
VCLPILARQPSTCHAAPPGDPGGNVTTGAAIDLCQPQTSSEIVRGNPGSHSTMVVVVQSVEDGNRDEPSSPWPGWQGKQRPQPGIRPKASKGLNHRCRVPANPGRHERTGRSTSWVVRPWRSPGQGGPDPRSRLRHHASKRVIWSKRTGFRFSKRASYDVTPKRIPIAALTTAAARIAKATNLRRTVWRSESW